MATKNVLSVSSESIECDLACEIVGDTGGKDLYIGDSTYTMYVTIRNEGSTTYTLTGQRPDEITNAHFELNFSAHILLAVGYDNTTYPRSDDTTNWVVTYQVVTGTSYITNLLLLYTGQTPVSLPPNGTLVVPIQYRTDPETDAETCRITVKPGNDNALWSPLPGCAAGLQVTENVAPYTFQLTAFIVGGDTLLNDGVTGNRFTLRLLNPTTTPILLQPNTTVFEISIDTAASASTTALSSTTDAQNISLSTSNIGLTTEVNGGSSGNTPRRVWTVKTGNQTNPIIIPATGSVDFTFTNVQTDMPPGRSMIYVRCINVPSMGGQVLISSVEKTPAFAAQGTGVNINAAQLLYAPSSLTSGGAGLVLKGDAITSGDRFLLKLDGTNGYTGIRMDNISGSGYGLYISGNTTSPVVQIEQNSTTNYSLRTDGGWGVGIYNVANQSSGLYVELSSVNAGVKVKQNSTGYSADLQGGAGVSISNIVGANMGLTLATNSTNIGLRLTQSGTGNSAIFYGGAGVSIETITGNNRGLNIATNSITDSLYINQTGTGMSARISGGAGVEIDGVTNGANGLYVNTNTNVDSVNINQSGTGHALKLSVNNTNQALYVSQNNSSGMAAKFTGNVEIDGNLTVKGGNIILQSDANSNVYQIILRTGQLISSQGATLFVQTSGNGPANIQVWRAYVSDNVQFGESQQAKIDYDYDGSTRGLRLEQSPDATKPSGYISAAG